MYRFEHSAPIDTQPQPEPAADDRSGQPLSQGFVVKLINMVASEYLSPELQDTIDELDHDQWYHGQVLETVLNHIEDQAPALVTDVGKNVYYSLQDQFMQMGLSKPTDVITTMPMLWQHVTRGASGEWRTEVLGPGAARVELQQPYNCLFEQGALKGALECFDATNVQVQHSQCMRNGAEYCVFDVTWSETNSD